MSSDLRFYLWPQRDLNPCYRLERAASWTWLDDGALAKSRAASVHGAYRPPTQRR